MSGASITHSATARLAAIYLGVIMLMSIGFSAIFYHASYHELGRQLPEGLGFATSNEPIIVGSQGPDLVGTILRTRVDQGRHDLLRNLFIINLLALAAAVPLSYFLARKSLEPIEESLEAQSRFVSDASHELRTPLTAIQTTNEVGLRKSKLTLTEAKKIIKQNVEDTTKLQQITNALLQLARAESNTQSQNLRTDIQDSVTDALNIVLVAAKTKRLKIEDNSPKAKVAASRQVVAQIVSILLDNSIKYSKPGKPIFIEGSAKAGWLKLAVRDQGVGITKADLPHVFERFYRSDKSRSAAGFGLGLSIARQLARAAGGDISLKSSTAKGTIATLSLPIAEERP